MPYLKRHKIKITSDFSKTMKARRKQSEILKSIERKNTPPIWNSVTCEIILQN